MRRRLALAGNESLELLLDTICNTFGGIIFISLLVVILLNSSSDVISSTPPTQKSQVELIKTDIERERLTRELREMKNALVQQQKIVNSIVSEAVLEAARDTERLQKEHSRLLIEKSKTVGATSATQQQINKLAQDASDRNYKLSKAMSQKKSLQQKLEEEVSQRSRTAVIPRLVETTLPKKIYFLKRGTLYGPVSLSTGEFNSTDFMETTQSGQIIIDANPSGGTAVDFKSENIQQLALKYDSVHSATHVVQLLVWPDSFEHFEVVRMATESVGLKYELTPCEANTVIRRGASDTTESTKVQ